MSALPVEAVPSQASPPATAAMARRPLSLAQKLTLAFLGLVSAVLVVNGAIDMALSWREAQATAVRVQQEKADAAAERVAQFVTELEGQMGWTTRAEWARVSVEQRRYDFIRLLRQAPAITELIQVDGQGREQLKLSRLEPDAVGSNLDLSADPRVVGALRDRAWYGPVTFRRGSEPYMAIGIAHVGRNAGATIAEVNLKLAWDVVTGIRVGETGYTFVTDRQGKLIAHPDMSLVLRDTNLSRLPQVAAAVADMADGKLETLRVTDGQGVDGRPELSAYAAVPKLGWLVFVDLPRDEAFAAVWAALWRTIALMALGVLLAGVAGMMLARRMLVPITELQAGAQRLGAGDLSLRVPVRTGDEIGALAERFNTMAGQIQESQETLEQKVEDRTADLNKSLAQQTATSDILRVISQSPTDVTPVFDTIVVAAVRLLRTDLAFVMLTDGKTVTPMAGATSSGQIDKMVPGRPVAPEDHFPSRVIASKQALELPDWSRIELPPHEQAIHDRFGINASLYLPMLRGDECVGVLTFASKEPRSFSPTDIALAESFRDQAVIAIENTRLFNETQEALEQQKASADILGVISNSMADAQPVFDKILESCKRLFSGDELDVLLVDEQGQLTIAAYLGDHYDIVAETFPAPVERTPAGRAIAERRVMHWPDLAEGEDVPGILRKMAKLLGYRSMVFAPMLWEGRGIGAVGVARSTGPFTPKELALLQTFADQAVIAIQNTRLFNETKEALEQQTATGKILQVIAASPTDITPVLRAVAEKACEVCDAYDGAVLLREGNDLLFSAHHGPIAIGLDKWPINRGWTAGRAVVDGKPVHVPDLMAPEAEEFPDGRELSIRMGHRSIVSVPLMRDGEAIGAIVLRRKEPQPFTSKQIALLQTFADQAIIAINNVHLFDEVQAKTRELETSLADLTAAQARLIQSEKLASLGQLTAGIAHEIKNPLNFVNNFADLSSDLVGEIEEALALAGDTLDPKIRAEVEDISAVLKSNLAKIVQHGRRADSIVKNMLAHSRESGGDRRMVDVNATVDEALNLAYHGARAERPGFNITLERDFDPDVGQLALYPQEFTRVLLNLIGNGFHAANKKRLDGAANGFEPTLLVTTKAYRDRIKIKVRDNGTGIPDAVKARIFEPFFTTKPTGEGTGLGLSLSHDIVVKQHGGKLDVATEPGAFTEFTVTLPRQTISQEAKS
jgi:signal transduction histidine kinase